MRQPSSIALSRWALLWVALSSTLGCKHALAQAAAAPVAAVVHSAATAEPSVRQVVHMAVTAARKLGPERVQALARSARLAGLVPQLRLQADRGLQQNLSSSASTDTAKTNAATGDNFSLGATLTFDFTRLVFATEEVRLLTVERWLMNDRHKLVAEVVRLYFQRRRLLREQASGAAPDPELADQIVEVEAMLDACTDNAFSEALARLRDK
ncbi:MAG: hypothetical protein JWN04_1560 [Myxococcaceae bacterium]|nr:hypothetical protein [Myxococcaceae bacterium]